MSPPVLYKTPKALQPLSLDQLKKLRAALRSGISPSKLCAKVQDDWGQLRDVKKPTLVKALARYRELVATDLEVIEDMGLRRSADVMRRQVQKNIDLMSTYSELVDIQMSRIRMAVELENEHGTLSKQTGFDIDVANRLLTGYVGTAVRAGVLQSLMPNVPKKDVPNVSQLAEHVLERPQLKEGLMAVIGSVLRDVQTGAVIDQ